MKTRLADFGITSETDSMETAIFVLYISSSKSSMKTRLTDFGTTSEIDTMETALFVLYILPLQNPA